MIVIQNGNLLNSDSTYIAHQCNCFSTMGAGVAKQLKEKYPQLYAADRSFPFPPEERLGKFSFSEIGNGYGFNLYGQYRWGTKTRQTDYKQLGYAMLGMVRKIEEIEQGLSAEEKRGRTISLPYGIGCGLAGGEWDKVYAVIDKILVEYGKKGVVLYRYDRQREGKLK